MLFGVGCTPDEGGDAATDSAPVELTLSKTEVAVGLEGDTVQFDVTSNADWVVTADQEGVEVTPATGKKNGTVTVTVPASSSVRTVNVTVAATKNRWYPELGQSFPDATTATLVIYQNMAGEIVEGGIASIKEAGTHEVEGAWVVATSSKSFLMTDASGAYILVFLNAAPSVTVGQVVNVSGEVELSDKSGLLQFKSTATVTPTGDTVTVGHGTPKNLTEYDALYAYCKNVEYAYAEMKAKLTVSGSYYNLYYDGKDGYDDYKGSISYPTTEIANELKSLNGAYVVVRGYMVGISGNVYANIVALEVEVDASHQVLSAENISGVSADGVENATHNIVVTALDQVTATPDGTVVTAASVEGNVLTYTVAANTGEARQGSIVLSAEGVESVTIKVAQLGAVESPEYNFMSDEALAYTASSASTLKAYSCKTKVNGAEEVNGSGFKLGTGSYNGTFQSAALGVEGNATLKFYAVAWSGKSAKLYIRLAGTDTNLAEFDLASNAGASNSEPYSITFADTDYYTVQLTGLTANSVLEFSTTAAYDASSNNSTGRALVVGAHIVGGTPSTPTTPEPEQPGGGETPETPTTPETPEGGETPETPASGETITGLTHIENLDGVAAGKYYFAAYSVKNSTTDVFVNYPYHLWTGTVTSGKADTANYAYADGVLTRDPNHTSAAPETEVAVEAELVAVEGKTNVYYIKFNNSYLSVSGYTANHKLVMSETALEWTAVEHTDGVVFQATDGTNSVTLCTGTAANDLLRQYKTASFENSITSNQPYNGVHLFKKN